MLEAIVLIFAPILGAMAFFIVSLCLFIVALKGADGRVFGARKRMLIASIVVLAVVAAFYLFVGYIFSNAMISM